MSNIKHLLSSLKNATENLDSESVASISKAIIETVENTKTLGIESYLEKLGDALGTYNETGVKQICEQLIKDLRNPNFDVLRKDIASILALLNKHRKFEQTAKVAETALQSFDCEPKVSKLYAQAMIELKQLTPSIHLLKHLEQRCIEQNCRAELAEARGLLGRAYKQIYIDSTNRSIGNTSAQSALEKSISLYLDEYQQCPQERTWHGINAVALSHRAEKDGIKVDREVSDSVLSELIKTIENKIPKHGKANSQESCELDRWSIATYAEALIASEQPEQALKWLVRYIDGVAAEDTHADAFQLASTLRQLEEVWQLNQDVPEEKKILDVLKAALLSQEGGAVTVDSPAAELSSVNEFLQDNNFEKVFGADRYKNLLWYKTGLEQASTVCRIEDRMGKGIGTGFLIHSSSLSLETHDEWMVLTNAHVVSNDTGEQSMNPNSLAPEEAYIRFEEGAASTNSLPITGVIATSGRYKLDFTLLSIEGLSGIPIKLPIAKSTPRVRANERLYIIGHPMGGSLSFSLHDNLLLDYETPKIHYRSPTEGGSSGSPVFNDRWELVGIHHSGSNKMKKLNGKSGHYEANEGICIHRIISAVKKQVKR